MSLYTVLFSSVIPASGTRQINKTFMKGLLTIQDQEHFKTHNKRKLRQQYRKSRFSGDKTAPLAVSFHHAWAAILDVFEKSARIGNSFLMLLGCPFGRYDFGTTLWEASGTYPSTHPRGWEYIVTKISSALIRKCGIHNDIRSFFTENDSIWQPRELYL